MSRPDVIVSEGDVPRGSVRAYVLGYALSLALTVSAYFIVKQQLVSGRALMAVLAVLAVSQLVVQLICFLHLGREAKPRWNLTVFAFMLVVLAILVFGSLWIMTNLDYHHQHPMTPEQTDNSILKDEGVRQ